MITANAAMSDGQSGSLTTTYSIILTDPCVTTSFVAEKIADSF
jgi:hypothetical protein